MAKNRKMESLFLASVFLFTLSLVSGQQKPCIVKGHLFTQLPWYGYIVQKTFQTSSAKVQYQFSFPVNASPKILIYHDDQIRNLKPGMTCEERENVLPVDNHQIISLLPNKTAGCTVQTDSEGPIVVCTGERNFASSGPRTWYFVVSRCKDTRLLSFWYYFNMTGYYGDCEADPLSDIYVPPPRFEEHQYVYIISSLVVIACISLIALVIFVVLWCKIRRRKPGKDKSNESLTSSQATMTQDIFFVNATLPPDRDTSDYSRSSSENYYEVIPERRSYESVDTDRLTVPGRLHQRGPYASRSVINNNHIMYHHNHNLNLTMPSRSSRESRQHNGIPNGLHNVPNGIHNVPNGIHNVPNGLQIQGVPNVQLQSQLQSDNPDTRQFKRTFPFNPNYPTIEDYPPPPYPMQRIIRGSYPQGHNPRHSRHLNLSGEQQGQALLPTIPVSPEHTVPNSPSQLLCMAETLA